MDTVYLECLVGFDGAGNPEPLREIGLPIMVQTLVKGEIVDALDSVKIQPSADTSRDQPGRIVPDTRIVASSDPRVVSALLESGQYALTDPPGAKAAEATADHRASRQRRAKNRIEE